MEDIGQKKEELIQSILVHHRERLEEYSLEGLEEELVSVTPEDEFDSENLPDGAVIEHDGYTTCDKCGGEATIVEESHMEDGREYMDWGVITCENKDCLHVHNLDYS